MAPHPSANSSVSDRPPNWTNEQKAHWPADALPTAVALHRQLAIPERHWHALKAQRPRRAAEQLAAALVQLLSASEASNAAAADGTQQCLALLEHAQQWLRAEISDPGCPSHRR